MADAQPLRVMIVAKEEPDEEPYTLLWDIREHTLDLVLGFGNGVWREMRIVAESEASLNWFRSLLGKGGYQGGNTPMKGTTLFRQGDECWAGFVFIDPQPKPLSKD